MNAHEFDNEHLPHLDLFEIEAFKRLAKDEGMSRAADFPDLQPTQEPAFYILNFDADAIGKRWPLMPHDDSEVIVNLSIEYNEPMVNEDGTVISSAVAVDIDSIVGDPYSGLIAEKEVRYLLPLDASEPSTVIEFRSDEVSSANEAVDFDSLSDEEILNHIQARADKRRPLTYDDVQLLRYLIHST